MPTPAVLNFEKLLAPISADHPEGVDLRADPSPVSDYYVIKDARNKAAAAERKISQGDTEELPPDWRTVVERGTKAISEKSKHLEVATYVVEGLLRQNGYAGLRDGFRLARELVEKYWDKLYPLPDDEGPDRMESRVGHLAGLNDGEGVSSLLVRLNLVPITGVTSVGEFTLGNHREATLTSKISDSKLREKKIAAGALSMDTFLKAIDETPPSFYVNLVQDLTQCVDEFNKLSTALKERCDGQEPPSSNIRSALEKTIDTIKDLVRNKLPAAGTPDAAGEAPADGAAAGADGAKPGTPGVPIDVIQNREDAFRNLLKVADYFRRTEPHSIVSYSLEQVVHWGRMSLPELLIELIPEEAPRKNVFKQVGIKPPEPPPKEAKK
jgi:type VI secretion system protein ImpA